MVWLDFTPQAGHEQAGRRLALVVLSPATYNRRSGLMLCCPVTNQAKGYSFEVPVVPGTGKITGVALADQMRCLDRHSCNASRLASVTSPCALVVSMKVRLLLT